MENPPVYYGIVIVQADKQSDWEPSNSKKRVSNSMLSGFFEGCHYNVCLQCGVV